MAWLILAPHVLTSIFFIVIPGLAMGVAARLRGWTLVAATPLLSLSAIAVAPIAANWAGMPWSIVPLIIVTVVASLVLFAIVSILRSIKSANISNVTSPESLTEPAARRNALTYLAAFLIACLIATFQWTQMLGSPSAFSQTYDNIFHLNATRWILDTGNGSSLTFNTMTNGTHPPTFYPAAWHDLVTLITSVTGSSNIVLATNAAIWAIMALIWPLGCLFLIRRLLPDASAFTIIAAGVLASSFAAFPSLLIGFGVLYPNCLAFALLPTLLGLAATVLRLVPTPSSDPSATLVVILLACLPGLFLAHPNALLTLVAMLSPMALLWGWRGIRRNWQSRRKRAWAHVGVTILGLSVFALIWRLGYTQPTWAAPNVSETSLGEIVLASPLLLRPFWILGILTIIGLITVARTSALRWWLGPFAVICVLWWAVSAMDDGLLRNLLVAGYYNDPYRLAALLPLILLPLCVAACDRLYVWADQTLQSRYAACATRLRLVTAVIAMIILIAGIQFSAAMRQHITWVAATYAVSADSILVNTDEYALLQKLPDIVDADERIATNPWNGSSMVYALDGLLTTTTHVGYISTPELDIINSSLNQAAVNPALVCPAADALNVRYALDFGSREVHGAYHPYPGLENLGTADGFSVAARVGEATLYKLDACG